MNKAEKKNWTLHEGVQMDAATAAEVAKIACALQSLSVYATLAYENEDAPADLQPLVNEGLEAMHKIFVW
ncbi:MAG: hypothetical protein KGZ83_22315 [Sulfuricella sp.]|nr:hypothetical protein [Sulfuricella sp.]